MSDEALCNALRYEKWDEAADRIELLATTNEQLVAINEALTAKVKLMDDLDVINGEKIEALTEQLEALNQWDSARHSVDVLEKRVAFVEEERRKTFQALLKVTKIHDDVETKLAKAVEGLQYYAVEAMPWDADDSLIARTALAEIESSEAVTLGEKG
jgi:prefoldin subunit 5